jgi:hypothetical protein
LKINDHLWSHPILPLSSIRWPADNRGACFESKGPARQGDTDGSPCRAACFVWQVLVIPQENNTYISAIIDPFHIMIFQVSSLSIKIHTNLHVFILTYPR